MGRLSTIFFFFLERKHKERALKYTHFELKNIVINESKFPKLDNYRILFTCFDYIPLSFECTDLKTLLQSRKINSLGLLKLDYHCIYFMTLRLFEGGVYSNKYGIKTTDQPDNMP